MKRERKYQDRTFDGTGDRGRLWGQRVLEHMTFKRCYFKGQGLSMVQRPEKRTIVRHMVLEDCETTGCTIGPAILDTVRVRNLKTSRLLQVWAAAFRRVKLEGRMPSLMVSPYFDAMLSQTPMQRRFEEANHEFYTTVDWAVDITEAEFPDVELLGIPACLVRSHPETSAVITRERVLSTGAWRTGDLDPVIRIMMERLLESSWNDEVLVAPRHHPRYGQLRAGLRRLVELGVAVAADQGERGTNGNVNTQEPESAKVHP